MIVPDSLQIGRIALAYLYQNAVAPTRKDNLAFYDAVTGEGLEFPEFQQHPKELVMIRRSGENIAELRVGQVDVINAAGGAVAKPFRFLLAETRSGKPIKFFKDDAENTFEKFLSIWGAQVGRLQLAELSMQGMFHAPDQGGAAGFLKTRVLQVGPAVGDHLKREFGNYAVKLASDPLVTIGDASKGPPLQGAQVELTLENQAQDPARLVFHLLLKWPMLQLPVRGLAIPQPLRDKLGGRDVIEINVEAQRPNSYIDAGYEYLTDHVVPFLKALSR